MVKKKMTGDELNAMATREEHTGKKTVVETVISTGTVLRKIKMEHWIASSDVVAGLYERYTDAQANEKSLLEVTFYIQGPLEGGLQPRSILT